MSPATFITILLATFATALPATEVRPGGLFGGRPSTFPRPGPPNPIPTRLPVPPRPTFPPPGVGPKPGQPLTCDTSAAVLTVPSGQTAVPAPSGKPSFVMLGVGTQNYTCGAAGTYTAAGAVAQLFDLSCLTTRDITAFESIQDNDVTASAAGTKLGEHFFQKNDAGGLSPIWDLRGDAAKGNADAFVIAAKKGNIPAPTGAQDVDWLFLESVSGGLAKGIYRTHTKGGQPPTSCTPGSPDITVRYTSKYWLYGSTVTL